MRYRELQHPRPLPSCIVESALESQRFGLHIGRLDLGTGEGHAPETVRDLIAASGLDLVVVRYPADRIDWFGRLLDPSYTLLHADTLVYYQRRLEAPETPLSPPSWAVDRPDQTEQSRIRALVRSAFDDYPSHYAANPRLDADRLVDGYAEWACAYTGREDAACIILSDADRDLGLVTVDAGDGVAEIALIGTSPPARERGVAAELMRQAEAWAMTRGAGEMVISTQAQNVRVQRVWARLGYRPVLALTTVHAILARD